MEFTNTPRNSYVDIGAVGKVIDELLASMMVGTWQKILIIHYHNHLQAFLQSLHAN